MTSRAFFELARSKTGRQPAVPGSIILFDLDHFKTINDRLGHDAGDSVLKEFAEICRRSVGQNDLVARFGGEEFVILLDEIAPDEAFKIAEDIRDRTSMTLFSPRSAALQVTVSAGIAELRDDLPEAIKTADTALYDAKRRGRNRVLQAVA